MTKLTLPSIIVYDSQSEDTPANGLRNLKSCINRKLSFTAFKSFRKKGKC